MKKILLTFQPWLLMAALCFSLIGCSDDNDEENEISKGQRELKKQTFNFSAFKKYGTYLVGYSQYQPSTICTWSADGAGFTVYLNQDGKLQTIGSYITSKEQSLNENERQGGLTYEIKLPTNIDQNRNYSVIAFTNNVSTSLVDNKISCNADLKRNNTVYIWDDDSYNIGGGAIGRPIYHSRPVMTIEGLKLFNNTSDTITFRHKGFESEEKWYYTKATVKISSDLSIETIGTSSDGEVISDVRKVAPNESFYMTSKYIPTGKKVKNAHLVLEINGKEVKTKAISSDVEIKYGEYYAMNVKWDGVNLEWITDIDNNK